MIRLTILMHSFKRSLGSMQILMKLVSNIVYLDQTRSSKEMKKSDQEPLGSFLFHSSRNIDKRLKTWLMIALNSIGLALRNLNLKPPVKKKLNPNVELSMPLSDKFTDD